MSILILLAATWLCMDIWFLCDGYIPRLWPVGCVAAFHGLRLAWQQTAITTWIAMSAFVWLMLVMVIIVFIRIHLTWRLACKLPDDRLMIRMQQVTLFHITVALSMCFV